MDMTKFDPNAPAFGEKAQKVEDLETPKEETKTEETSVEAPKEEVKEEVKEEEKSEDLVEEQKVPYSRFKKFHESSKEFEREAEFWKAEAERLKLQRAEVEDTNELPDYWKELYGDTDASKRAWSVEQQRQERIFKEAEERSIKAVESRRLQEDERLDENLGELDNRLDRLSQSVGRDLTEKEQSSILDIIDEFTPKDEDDNYQGAILSEEKAWEIYQMRQKASEAPKKLSRDNVASLSGSQTQGETSVGGDKDKDFNPSWGALQGVFKKRLG